MTASEATNIIKEHARIHLRKEPHAVYISEALQMACEALEKQIEKEAKNIAESEQPYYIIIKDDALKTEEIIEALKTQKCVVMPDGESNVEWIDIKAIKSEAVREFADEVKYEIEQALQSNYVAKTKYTEKYYNVNGYDELMNYCNGKIDCLRGLEYFLDDLLKETEQRYA